MGLFGTTLKDIITNIVSLVLGILSAVQVYMGTLGEGEVNWFMLIMTVGGAIVAFFTGRTSNGRASTL